MKIHSMTQKQTPKTKTKLVDLQISFQAKHIAGAILVSLGLTILSCFVN